MKIKVMKKVMQANIDKAIEIRELLGRKNILMVNLIGSPGAGKTLLIEKTLSRLKEKYNIATIEGDIASNKDALRLQKYGIPVVLINTYGSCHLDSASIEKAILELDLDSLDLIFVENVGNLVCPAEFDIGEDIKVAVASTTEGDDKPEKYPLLFREAGLVLLNKMDLIPYTNFNIKMFYSSVRKLNGLLSIFDVSCVDENGINRWIDWLEEHISNKTGITVSI